MIAGEHDGYFPPFSLSIDFLQPDNYTDTMISDLSRKLREKVIASLSDTEKVELNEKEAKELLSLNPGYAITYFRTSLLNKQKYLKRK